MMPRAHKVCSCTRCPAHEGRNCTEVIPPGQSRCPTCIKAADGIRGTAARRGYGHKHRERFRKKVLERDPLCVCTDAKHGHRGVCGVPSRVADHYPLSKRELIALGMDDNDPQHGRGLCTRCDPKQTARRQPGGWHGLSSR